jgi:hypothetical protein
MKKFFAFVAIAAVTVTPALAATGARTAATPAATSTLETANTRAAFRFSTDFKGASGIWSDEQNYNEVLFFWHNELMDAYYDKDGNLIGTFHQVDASELPAKATSKIASWYKGYDVKSTTVMEKDGQDPVYYVTVQSPAHLLILAVDQTGSVEEFKTIR